MKGHAPEGWGTNLAVTVVFVLVIFFLVLAVILKAAYRISKDKIVSRIWIGEIVKYDMIHYEEEFIYAAADEIIRTTFYK